MERSKRIIIVLILVSVSGWLQASERSAIYRAFINDDMPTWKATIDSMQAAETKDNAFLLELVNYQYGFIGWCIGNQKKEEVRKYLELAEANLKLLEKRSFKPSHINSYKSAFYGFRIGLNVLNAPFIGPKSLASAELAMKQDSTNPFGFIQYANSQYYMPAAFGGSKSLALTYYQRAVKIMEQNPDAIKGDWNYLSLLVTIGQAYTEMNNYKAAKQYYEHILKFEPGFTWVKNELYPNLIKRIK